MRLNLLNLLLATLSNLVLINAFLTYDSIRNLTALTDDCRAKIVEGEEGVERVVTVLGGGQGVLMGAHGGGDGDEVEVTVAAALRLLCSNLLIELEKPLPTVTPSRPKCQVVIKEWHEFLGATVKFLREVQERQMLWRWEGESPVFDGVSWLQGLWARRKANKQDRSFIEQQMLLYDYHGSKSCFGKSDEVLHRDVEIVEYLNDLIDSF